MKVAVLGASGRTGSLVVAKLLGKGHRVVAVSRSPGSWPAPDGMLETAVGDMTSKIFVGKAIAGCDGVISCIGHNHKTKNLWSPSTSPKDILSKVSRAIVGALGNENRAHYVYLSAFGVGEDMKKHSLLFRLLLRTTPIWNAYKDHAEAERIIKASGAVWTIVKPPGLTEGDDEVPLIDKSKKWSSFETVSKRSLAAYLADCVSDSSSIGKSLTIGAPAK